MASFNVAVKEIKAPKLLENAQSLLIYHCQSFSNVKETLLNPSSMTNI